MRQLLIIIFISLFVACDNKHNTEELIPLDYKFDSTNFERNIIVVSDTLDTIAINSSIRLEKLSQDITYQVYNSRDFCKVLKFDNNIPYYLYYSIMGEIGMNHTRKRDCFILDINKHDPKQTYILRYYNPIISLNEKEYYYGKFLGGKPFVVDLFKLIDTAINKCAYEYHKIPLDTNIDKYLNNEYFKLADLDNIKEPSYSVTISGVKK